MKHILITLAFCAAPTWAQPVYKCGNNYSQVPCGANAKAIDIAPPPAPDPNSIEGMRERWRKEDVARKKADEIAQKNRAVSRQKDEEEKREIENDVAAAGKVAEPAAAVLAGNKEKCTASIKGRLKDPDSAKFTDVIRLSQAVVGLDIDTGIKFPGIAYTTSVNAKNSYGGYVGYKTYTCYFDLSEIRIRGLLF